MATITAERSRPTAVEADLKRGSALMGVAAAGFIGYGVIFCVRNFTDARSSSWASARTR